MRALEGALEQIPEQVLWPDAETNLATDEIVKSYI